MDDFNQDWLAMDLSAPLQGAPPPPPAPAAAAAGAAAPGPGLGPAPAPYPGPTPLTGFDPLSTPTPGGPSSDPAPPAAPREILKLDDTRLLQPDALPHLRSVCKNMKFSKSKGSELANLDKLVHFYKVWAHRVFPRYPYDRFVERTMRVCRTKRVKGQMNQWIREELESRGTYDVDPDADMLDGDFDNGGGKMGDKELDKYEDRMDVDGPMPTPTPEPLAPPPPTSTAAGTSPPTLSSDSSPTITAKQRALDRLAHLKQSRFRRPMSPASLASLPSLASTAPASAFPSSLSAPSLAWSSAGVAPDRVTGTSTPPAPASASARRVIIDSDDDDDDLVIVPSYPSAGAQHNPSASQGAGMGVFADMANDEDEDAGGEGSAFAAADQDQGNADKADAAAAADAKNKETKAAEMGLSASLLEGVDVDALFALDDEQW